MIGEMKKRTWSLEGVLRSPRGSRRRPGLITQVLSMLLEPVLRQLWLDEVRRLAVGGRGRVFRWHRSKQLGIEYPGARAQHWRRPTQFVGRVECDGEALEFESKTKTTRPPPRVETLGAGFPALLS